MANSKIYVPGKNDFLDWAKKMNKNAELDMKKADARLQTINGGAVAQSAAGEGLAPYASAVRGTQSAANSQTLGNLGGIK